MARVGRVVQAGGADEPVRVAALAVFPVKSLRGFACTEAMVDPCGLAGDRRWMVVDQAGRCMTQREHATMALLQARLHADGVHLSGADDGGVIAPAGGAGAVVVGVWKDAVAAEDCGEEAAAWLTRAIGQPCRLVYLSDAAARPVTRPYAENAGEAVSFADGFPMLLTSSSSLDDVNGRLAVAVPMLRFRPNVVVSGVPPWDEDSWRRVRIGGVVLRVAKPCDRCIVTTIDPQTGLRPQGNEPLATMGSFRRAAGGGIMFGQNLVPERYGTISVGDAMAVLERAPPFRPATGRQAAPSSGDARVDATTESPRISPAACR